MKNEFSRTSPSLNTQDKDNQIKPCFKNLLNPRAVNSHLDEMLETVDDEQREETNVFPVDVLPKAIQEIVSATNECLKFPVDFIGASLLYAVAVSIGNTYRVEIKRGWQEGAVLYLSIVGSAGTNKSHPISFALTPIENRDNLKYLKYQKEKLEYDAISALTKKERGQQGHDEPVRPVLEQHLVSDFTPEALTEVHKFNNRGIGVYADELASWFNNFNRYNKGSEEQFWLTVWSGKPIRINRKTSEPIYISLPFIPVIGTIQPGVLGKLADNRTENGFLDRLLFVVPDSLNKEYWSENELDPAISEKWETIISKLLDLPLVLDKNNNPTPAVLNFSDDAKRLVFKWQRELTDQSNKAENEALKGINAKIEIYAARLALILQLVRYACNEGDKSAVGFEAVQGALKLVEYFKKTAIKVNAVVSDASPTDKLPTDKQALYKALPDAFATSEGVQVAKNLGIPERTFKRFLNKKDLFHRISQGEYEKLY